MTRTNRITAMGNALGIKVLMNEQLLFPEESSRRKGRVNAHGCVCVSREIQLNMFAHAFRCNSGQLNVLLT